MKKFRCQLCGGKIQNGRCSLCGWINQEDREYILNKSQCDGKPLTHVHGAPAMGSSEFQAKLAERKVKLAQQRHTKVSSRPTKVSSRPRSMPGKRTDGKNLKKKINIVTIIIALIVLLPTVMELAPEVLQSLFDSDAEVASAEYEGVMYDLPEDGEYWSEELTAGIYTVGVDIPEGIYRLEAMEGYGSFRLTDSENSIYLHQFFSAEESGDADEVQYLENVWLYQGASVHLRNSLHLQFQTENGDTELQAAANPLTESVNLKSEESMTAGVNFPSGTYDVLIQDGWGSFTYETPYLDYENNVEYDYDSESLDTEYGDDGTFCFYHVELIDGTQVKADGVDLILVPSDRVLPEEYSKSQDGESDSDEEYDSDDSDLEFF